MTEITALISVITFLFGVLITVLIFVFGFRDRLTRVEEAVKAIRDQLSLLNTLAGSRPICEFHALLDKQGAVREERLTQLEESVRVMKEDKSG